MASKQETSLIINSLNTIQETLFDYGKKQDDIREKLSNVDKSNDVLAQKIIAYDAKHEAKYSELNKKQVEFEEKQNQIVLDVDDIKALKGKIVFLLSVITFIAAFLGINGIDLLKKVFARKQVDTVYVQGVEYQPNYE